MRLQVNTNTKIIIKKIKSTKRAEVIRVGVMNSDLTIVLMFFQQKISN